MPDVKVAKTPTYVIPDTHRPEEFLTDDKLAVYHQERYDATPDDHPDKGALKIAAARAQVAAAVTAQVVAEAEAAAIAAIDKAKKK